MKNFTAYGLVVQGELKAVFLEKYHCARECTYYRHLGNPLVVDLQVTPESLEFINKSLQEAQDKESA